MKSKLFYRVKELLLHIGKKWDKLSVSEDTATSFAYANIIPIGCTLTARIQTITPSLLYTGCYHDYYYSRRGYSTLLRCHPARNAVRRRMRVNACLSILLSISSIYLPVPLLYIFIRDTSLVRSLRWMRSILFGGCGSGVLLFWYIS